MTTTRANDAVDALPAARADEPEERVGNRELRVAICVRRLRQLPPLQRDAFLLQQESGLSLTGDRRL